MRKNTLMIALPLLLGFAVYASVLVINKINKIYDNTPVKVKLAVGDVDPAAWRGVNLPLALNPNKERVLSQADFDYCTTAGANIVRLSVHADDADPQFVNFFDAGGHILPPDQSPAIADLRSIVEMARKSNLKIIIDMHTSPGHKTADMWNDQAYWDKLVSIWTTTAEAFKGDPTVVAFDLMNEPNIINYIRKQNFVSKGMDEGAMFAGRWSPPADWKDTPRDYNAEITTLIDKIRQIDPNRCAIVEGFGILGNPVNFSWMKPITGFKNIIYSFHMYVPTDLTMLGTKGSIAKGNSDNVKPFDPASDESKIDKAFAPVLAFQKEYNVPIYVGEFGITNEGVFGKDANGNTYNAPCWLSSVIKKMNDYGWGWTYWDFWTDIRKPRSNDDPRYKILSAAMKGETIPSYCNL